MIKGSTRLVIVFSLVLGLGASIASGSSVSYSDFLHSKAYDIAWQNQYPNRDPMYEEHKKGPNWERSVDAANYDQALQSLVNAPGKQRRKLHIEYYWYYIVIPFIGTVAGVWTLILVTLWIRAGFRKRRS
jgi:hypothetical protein